jgi:hypothetical protein
MNECTEEYSYYSEDEVDENDTYKKKKEDKIA